ncbi:MAG: histidine phosphatase family protein [Dehalococcoidia bacterium]
MSQRLYLVRHAVALPRDPARWPEDSERPLSRGGERYFRRVARGLARTVAPPEVVCSSPWLRAWETALILESAGWPGPQVLPALAPGGDPEAVVATIPAEAGRVVLVGHEPDLGRLASFLLTGDPDRVSIEVKKGGVMLLDHDRDRARATLKWHAAPQFLRRIG